MKYSFSFKQPNIRAKIIGIVLIVLGLDLLFTYDTFYIKLAFASILIGILLIFMITEKTTPNRISQAQIEGNLNAFDKITKNLNLAGNAVFVSSSDILSEERIFIPLEKKYMKIPEIHDDFVFSTGMDGESLGIALPPSGLKLLEEAEKETDFNNINIENIEDPLQTFIGMDLLKSITFKRLKNSLKLIVDKPVFCNNNKTLCKQFPCPTCSAVLTAITRSLKKNLWIKDVTYNGKKIEFDLQIGD